MPALGNRHGLKERVGAEDGDRLAVEMRSPVRVVGVADENDSFARRIHEYAGLAGTEVRVRSLRTSFLAWREARLRLQDDLGRGIEREVGDLRDRRLDPRDDPPSSEHRGARRLDGHVV